MVRKTKNKIKESEYIWQFREGLGIHRCLKIKTIVKEIRNYGYRIKDRYTKDFIRSRDAYSDVNNSSFLEKSWKDTTKKEKQWQ